MEPTFFVICRLDDNEDGTPGEYVLATRKTFATRAFADRFAKGIAPGRMPIVVEAMKGMTYSAEPVTRPMQAFFYRHGLTVVINTDDKAAETRANEIAAKQFKEAGINEAPALLGVATLPKDGVITAWDRTVKTERAPSFPVPHTFEPTEPGSDTCCICGKYDRYEKFHGPLTRRGNPR